jgi:hypothetical protein
MKIGMSRPFRRPRSVKDGSGQEMRRVLPRDQTFSVARCPVTLSLDVGLGRVGGGYRGGPGQPTSDGLPHTEPRVCQL